MRHLCIFRKPLNHTPISNPNNSLIHYVRTGWNHFFDLPSVPYLYSDVFQGEITELFAMGFVLIPVLCHVTSLWLLKSLGSRLHVLALLGYPGKPPTYHV